jgi:mycothiol system anti-sigma-R factor
MNCEEAINLIDGYLDGELDPITNQEIERHLRDCPACEQAYKTQRALVRTIGSAAPYYKAPAELRQRIQSSLRDEIDLKARHNVTRRNQILGTRQEAGGRTVLFGAPWNWLALAATIILAAIIVSNLLPRSQRPGGDQFLATQLIASHVRSLMANHLSDVASSDQHTVKPWLDARLDFAPPVVDLTNEGFPLVGGRLDYLDNRPVAALIYHRRQHFINLFIWPAGADADKNSKTLTRDGYQLLHWVSSPFNYWAVSDVSEADLQAFRQVFEGQTARH